MVIRVLNYRENVVREFSELQYEFKLSYYFNDEWLYYSGAHDNIIVSTMI